MSLLTSLVSYWKCDEGSGDLVDAHGSNTLTDNNTVGDAGTGVISGSRWCDSTHSEYFSKADNADLSTGDIDFTFSAWIAIGDDSAHRCVFSKSTTAAPGVVEYYLIWNQSTSKMTWLVSNDGTAFTAVSSTATVSSGVPFTHVICWHDAANNEIGIVLNNGSADTASHTTGVLDGSGPFNIGRNPSDGGTWLFDGYLDEIGFWKRMLTPTERTNLYNSGSGLPYSSFGGGGTSGPLTNLYFRRRR